MINKNPFYYCSNVFEYLLAAKDSGVNIESELFKLGRIFEVIPRESNNEKTKVYVQYLYSDDEEVIVNKFNSLGKRLEDGLSVPIERFNFYKPLNKNLQRLKINLNCLLED